jgi:hypothetical protein
MQPFSLEQVEQIRAQLNSAGCPIESVECEGRTYPYFVIQRDRNPQLPKFAMRVTPTLEEIAAAEDPMKVTVFGVSDEVPVEFRPLWVAHEVFEFCHIGLDHEGRCKEAAIREISMAMKLLSAAKLKEYLALRVVFFADLLVYAHGAPSGFVSQDIREFVGSLLTFRDAECHG